MRPLPSTKLIATQGDITRLQGDAIVNAANNSLRGGGGVDGAIHWTAGPELLAECIAKYPEGCPTGEARITGGYNLPAKYVIHTVGPIYGEEEEDEEFLLGQCYKNCLKIATERKLSNISFPCISTGIYGYPKREAARVAVHAVKEFLKVNPGTSLKEVNFVAYGNEDWDIYGKLLA